MDKKLYRVTEKAGPRINGQRVALGQTLSLTKAEAEYHADLGEIALVSDQSGAAAADKKRGG